MTTQVNLGKIWANTGGVTDPGDVKYTNGWISEIPTYQNFNFVLQNNSKNLLVAAEGAGFDWQGDINYISGAIVRSGGKKYYCHLANLNQDPAGDSTNSYWSLSESWGETHTYSAKVGAVNNVMFTRGADLWLGQDQTIINTDNSFVLFADKSIRTNILFGMSNGELITKAVGNVIEPDGQNIHPDTGGSRIFHEDHPPVQSEVAGTIPEAPNDSTVYGRGQDGWVPVAGIDGLKPFPSGTRIVFSMASAPTGWTQDTSDKTSNRLLRVTNAIGDGVGGVDELSTRAGAVLHNIIMGKVPSHTHVVGTGSQGANHTHVVSGNTGNQSANHAHYTNLTSGSNNRTHTHGDGSLTTNVTGGHAHVVGVKIKFDEDDTGRNGTTDSWKDNQTLYSSSDGAHAHTVTGTTASNSVTHTHSVTGNTGNNNASHSHNFSVASGSNSGSHNHPALCDYNQDGSFDLDTGSGIETRVNPDGTTGDWEPKYLNLIVCQAN